MNGQDHRQAGLLGHDLLDVVRDPRVETLCGWARDAGRLSDRAAASLEALEDALPRPYTAPALAYAASAAYARVPGTGPRDLRAGNRIVRVLAQLGEAGACELMRMRDSVTYLHERHAIEKALAVVEQWVGVPPAELVDLFVGVELDAQLRACVLVGGYVAMIGVTPDLRRVRTAWRDALGRESSRRPRGAAEFGEDLTAVEDVRRRLRAHLAALRHRLEQAMIAGESWPAERWAGVMFADPLRAAMARRLIWRIECERSVLALPQASGFTDVHGAEVAISLQDRIALWHPADQPAAHDAWRHRLATVGVQQPIEQTARKVTFADPASAHLSFAAGARVDQRRFSGFLRNRGWDVPYMGRWFFIGEATRQVTKGGPIAVLEVDVDWNRDELDVGVVGGLAFRSTCDSELDARAIPPAIVSEAAGDVLGAMAAAELG